MSADPINLLIVDDDPVFAFFVRQHVLALANDLPCDPHWADTPGKALAELDQHAYDIVLLDYNLPEADGLQVLGQIRELPPERQPAVIMLTASGSEAIAVEAMKRGARDYLTKATLDGPPLARAIHGALSQKRLADRVAEMDRQMREDLVMARQLQQSLLPTAFPRFPRAATPENSRLRFHSRFQPAADLAGDFFNVVALSDDSAGVFICDVMGHGVRSALVTAMLRAMVDDLAGRSPTPGDFLSEVNRRLHALIRPADAPLFATACYLVVDTARRRVQFSVAGHPRPVHLQPSANRVSRLALSSAAGPALGLTAEAAYATGEIELSEGDLLLLFTDGIFEVPAADGSEDFGQSRLLASATAHLHLPPPQLLDALLTEVRQFSGADEFGDDVCLLAVEVAALAATPQP